MAKRNKFFKNKKIPAQKVLQPKKDKSGILSKTFNAGVPNVDVDLEMSTENVQQTNKKDLNKTILNEEAVERHSNLFGIEKEKLRKFLQNPLRNRRQITKVVLSRGQKKRLEKKEKFKNKKELVEKIKLNQSMINNTMNKSLNVTKNLETKKNDNFNLCDFNNTLANLMDEFSENKKVDKKPCDFEIKNKKKNAKQLKNLLNSEKEKIKKVIENKNYQANPLEAMKFHIKNSFILQERNKKIEENYQKNYNFLNLNK